MLCLSLYNQAGYWQMQGSYATGLVGVSALHEKTDMMGFYQGF